MSESKTIKDIERAVEKLTVQVQLLEAEVAALRNRRPSNPNPVIGPGVWSPTKPPYQIRNEEKKKT